MRLLAGSAAVLVLTFATACGGGSTPATSGPGSSGGDNTLAPFTPPPATPGGPQAAATCGSTAAASGPVISIEGTHSLNPSDETIKAGDSVTWTNNGTSTHQIAFATGPKCAFQIAGKSVSITFSNPGTYAYICSIHPTFMKGTITVQ